MCFCFRSFPFRSTFFRPLLFRFWLLSLLFLPFLFFPASPHSGFSGAASPPFGFLAFPLPFHPVSRVSRPFSSTQLSVCFLSSFPVSLPQLFHRCFPFAFAFGLSPFLPLSFVCFRSGSDYSAFCFFRSLLPVLASQWLLQCSSSAFRLPAFHLLFRLVSHASFSVSGTWLSCNSLSRFSASHHRCYCSFRPPVSSSAVPLGLRFRFWYFGRAMYPEN